MLSKLVSAQKSKKRARKILATLVGGSVVVGDDMSTSGGKAMVKGGFIDF